MVAYSSDAAPGDDQIAQTPDPRGGEPPAATRRWLGGPVVIALISAVAALSGAIVGGVATYLGNKSLQENQSRSVAVGNARVLQARVLQADARLKFMLELHLLLPPDPAVGSLTPSIQDEQSIAANLNPKEWSTIALGLSSYSLFAEADSLDDLDAAEAARGLRVPLDTRHRRMIRSDGSAPQEAAVAFDALTGSP